MHEEFSYYSPYTDMFKLVPEDIKPFNIQLAGMAFCDETYIIYRPDSPIWCFEYIIEGKGYLTQDNEHFTAEKGDLYILRTNATHYYYSDAKDPWTKIYFCIYGELVEKIMEGYGIKYLNLVKNIDVYELFREFSDICRASRTKDEMNDKCLIVFIKILEQVMHRIGTDIANKGIAERLKHEIDNIVDYSLEKSSYDSIIARLGCSKSHAIRLFKEEYTITPYQYMLQNKITVAKNMLTNTFLSTQEITDKLNFCDTRHFSVTFKRFTGYSPIQYRKKFRQHIKE